MEPIPLLESKFINYSALSAFFIDLIWNFRLSDSVSSPHSDHVALFNLCSFNLKDNSNVREETMIKTLKNKIPGTLKQIWRGILTLLIFFVFPLVVFVVPEALTPRKYCFSVRLINWKIINNRLMTKLNWETTSKTTCRFSL